MSLSHMDKAGIRVAALRLRDTLDPEARREKDRRIHDLFLGLPEYGQAATIAYYASFRSEAGTFHLIRKAIEDGKKVLLPRVARHENRLELLRIRSMQELVRGAWGILEPMQGFESPTDIGDVDLVVMPGAAFDPAGNRLGYGAGFYDRLLGGAPEKPVRVALAYTEQIVEKIPSEEFDQRVHLIVTDQGVIRCR